MNVEEPRFLDDLLKISKQLEIDFERLNFFEIKPLLRELRRKYVRMVGRVENQQTVVVPNLIEELLKAIEIIEKRPKDLYELIEDLIKKEESKV